MIPHLALAGTAKATLALNSGGWFRLFRLIASLQSVLLMMEKSTYRRPTT